MASKSVTPSKGSPDVMDIDQGPSPTPLSTQLLEELSISKDPNNKQIWALVQKIMPVVDKLRAKVGELEAEVGKLMAKSTRQESKIALLETTLSEHGAALDKIGEITLNGPTTLQVAGINTKVDAVADEVRTKASAREVEMITLELTKMRFNAINPAINLSKQQGGTQGTLKGPGETTSFATITRGPAAQQTLGEKLLHFHQVTAEEEAKAVNLRRHNLLFSGLSASTPGEAEAAVTEILQSLGVSNDLWFNPELLSKPGHQSLVKVTFYSMEARATVFRAKGKLREQQIYPRDDLTMDEKMQRKEMTPTSIKLYARGWIIRWKGPILQFHGRLVAGGPLGWHVWSQEVPEDLEGNIRPRKSPGAIGGGPEGDAGVSA